MIHQFKAFCSGFSSTPQVFSRVFALVSKWEHQKSISQLQYLDDWLIIVDFCPFYLQLCQDLGIVINWEKSDLEPTQRPQYL